MQSVQQRLRQKHCRIKKIKKMLTSPYRSKTTTANYSKTSFHSKLYIQHADLPAFRIKISLDSNLFLLCSEVGHKDSPPFYHKSFFDCLTKSSVKAHDRGFEGDDVIMSCPPRKTHDCQNGCTAHTRMTIGGQTPGNPKVRGIFEVQPFTDLMRQRGENELPIFCKTCSRYEGTVDH